MNTPIDPAYVEYCEKRISELERQVAALTKENDRLKIVPMKYRRMEFNAQLQNQLAAAQAVDEKLRKALSYYALGGRNGDRLKEALAISSDDSALQARLAEEREKIVVWLRNNYQDYSLSGICDAIRSMK